MATLIQVGICDSRYYMVIDVAIGPRGVPASMYSLWGRNHFSSTTMARWLPLDPIVAMSHSLVDRSPLRRTIINIREPSLWPGKRFLIHQPCTKPICRALCQYVVQPCTPPICGAAVHAANMSRSRAFWQYVMQPCKARSQYVVQQCTLPMCRTAVHESNMSCSRARSQYVV